MILNRYYPSRFKKDYKRVKAQGKDIQTLLDVMDRLQNEERLEAAFFDHDLKGKLEGLSGMSPCPGLASSLHD